MPPETKKDAPPADAPPAEEETTAGARWQADLAPEGVATSDDRYFEKGAFRWRNPPLTLMAMHETPDFGGTHAGAQIAGRMETIARDAGRDWITSEGTFDTGDHGGATERMVGDGTLGGISIDFVPHEMEWRQKDDNGQPGDEQAEVDEFEMMFGGGDDLMPVFLDAEIVGATVCPFPAFEEARISLVSSAGGPLVLRLEHAGRVRLVEPLSVVAAGMSLVELPPAAWFGDPRLARPTPLTVSDEGRVSGHAALWGQCHTGFPGVCRTAPRGCTYDYFHHGELTTQEGSRVAVGPITLGTGHAPLSASRPVAVAHYDDTGTAVADVVAGEDAHGLWVAGALRPTLDAARVRELRCASLSGDWRGVNGRLELVGLLAVNVPGFPIPRPRARVASAAAGVEALVAAGVAQRRGSPRPGHPERGAGRRSGGAATLEALLARARGRDPLEALLERARA